MVRVSSFIHHNGPVGSRIGYSLTELDEKGNTVKENVRGHFIVLDAELQGHIDAINAYILKRLEE